MNLQSTNGEVFTLDQSFNRGGEAEIWSIRREPHLVAKLYHQPTAEHEAKVAAMVAGPPQQNGTHPAVAWPLQLLYQQRHFVGFLMPRIHDSRPIFHFYNPLRRARLSESYAWRHFLHRAARNLATAVALVHKRGHVVGDLNESNVLVDRNALVTLVDSDSFQIMGPQSNGRAGSHIFRSPVGKAEFTPPELQGVDFKSVNRKAEHDNFGLAVLIFYLLMEGYHPFSGVLSDGVSVGRVDLHGIKHGLFPHTRNSTVQPPPGAPIFMWLDPELQKLFRRAFVEGHATPQCRPTAAEWHDALVDAEAALVSCPTQSTHIYARHLRRCPHCNRNAVPDLPDLSLDSRQSTSVATGEIYDNHTGKMTDGWPQMLTAIRHQEWLVVTRLLWTRAQEGVQRGRGQSIRLWYGVQQQIKLILIWLLAVPERLRALQHAIKLYGTLWQRWLIGNAVGTPAGILAATGSYRFAGYIAGSETFAPLIMPLMTDEHSSPRWLWIFCTVCFGLLVGSGQAWALRRSLLRWHYLPIAWIGGTVLASALLGALLFDALDLTALTQQSTSIEGLWMRGIVVLFGATLGYLQSLILRQQLQRADDGRFWMIANGLAWLLVAEGIRWGITWDLGQSAVSEWSVMATTDPELWLWIGGWLGSAAGLLLAGLLTGSVLLWMLYGPRRGYQPTATNVRWSSWRTLPQNVRHGTLRWMRGILLLGVFVFLLELILIWGTTP